MKKLMYLISALIILGGVGLLGYPSFANYINQKYANNEISEYDDQVKNMSQQKIEDMFALARHYNESLPGSFPADPFSGENITDFTNTEYENFFMVQEGEIIGYVEVPDIDVYLPIYYGTQEEELQKGAGLVVNTSLPVGGKGTHAVVSAHTGLASKKMFTDLVKVKEGAVFFIHILNQDLAYEVNQIKVVLPEETDDLLIQEDKDYVTLLTCTPFGVNDHRLLVRGERVLDYNFEEEETTVQQQITKAKDTYFWMIVLIVFSIIVVFFVVITRIKNRKKKNIEGGKK